MRRILIVGATSAIAEATARIWAQAGNCLFLAARNSTRLEAIAADLRVRGCPLVETYLMDANDFDSHLPALDAAERALGGLDTVLIAHGTLADQALCQQSVELAMQEIKTNALSVVALLTHVANRFERQKTGVIVVVSSVAGDRGRQSNYVYGSAKAMVTAFTSGLRNRLHKSGVAVVTIKPGLVDSPMTSRFKKGFLWSSPRRIGVSIVRACNRKADVVYAPGFWRGIMAIVKLAPEFVFKRMSL